MLRTCSPTSDTHGAGTSTSPTASGVTGRSTSSSFPGRRRTSISSWRFRFPRDLGGAGVVFTPDLLRQARYGAVGSRRCGHAARGADGRRPRSHGCGGLRAGGRHGHIRRRPDEHPLRSDVSRAGVGARPVRNVRRTLWAHDYPWGILRRSTDPRSKPWRRGWLTRAVRGVRTLGLPDGHRGGACGADPLSPGRRKPRGPRCARTDEHGNRRSRRARRNSGANTRVAMRTRPMGPIEQGRDLAERIPGSTFVELDCGSHIPAKPKCR